MRILIVCDFLFKYGSQQARSLVNAGHDVAMLCRDHALEFGGSEAERDEVMEDLQRAGVRTFVVPGRVRSFRAVPATFGIRRELGRWRPHIVHVHENHDPRLLAATSGHRTVLTIHDPLEHTGARAWTRVETWVFDRWLRRAACFVVHGSALAEELAGIRGGVPIAVIPHGTSPHPEPVPPPTRPCVLMFGRLEQYKGLEVLVAAMRLVWERRPDVRLVVAGEGEAARLVPVDPRIALLDRYISEREVDGLLAGATLVALPYTQASQSGVGLLAIGRGVPVAVSALGALPELVHDRSYISPPGDPRALSETILRHVDDGMQARWAVLRHARDHFSWDHVATLTTDLYRALVSERGS